MPGTTRSTDHYPSEEIDMGLFSRKTEPKTSPADIGRTSPPTPEQVRRYAELRRGGATPLEATRTIRAEAGQKK